MVNPTSQGVEQPLQQACLYRGQRPVTKLGEAKMMAGQRTMVQDPLNLGLVLSFDLLGVAKCRRNGRTPPYSR